MPERYRRADAATLDAQVAEMDAMFRPHAREAGERVVDIYTRKHTSPFMAEMSRSMELWMKNWVGEDRQPLRARIRAIGVPSPVRRLRVSGPRRAAHPLRSPIGRQRPFGRGDGPR